jgi:hypothetical protein
MIWCSAKHASRRVSESTEWRGPRSSSHAEASSPGRCIGKACCHGRSIKSCGKSLEPGLARGFVCRRRRRRRLVAWSVRRTPNISCPRPRACRFNGIRQIALSEPRTRPHTATSPHRPPKSLQHPCPRRRRRRRKAPQALRAARSPLRPNPKPSCGGPEVGGGAGRGASHYPITAPRRIGQPAYRPSRKGSLRVGRRFFFCLGRDPGDPAFMLLTWGGRRVGRRRRTTDDGGQTQDEPGSSSSRNPPP